MKRNILRSVVVLMITGIIVLCSGQVSGPAYAKVGDVVGEIYSTDILAFINDLPAPAYNIGGTTVIIIEDLQENGFNFNYNDELRTLLVYTDEWWEPPVPKPISRGVPGQVTGRIYETDIKTYVNGLPIQAYALDGKMAVAIEDLGRLTDSNLEYSPYNMRAVWNGADRSISLYFLYDNTREFDFGGRDAYLVMENDTVSFHIQKFDNVNGWSLTDTEDFHPPSSYPIYCDNQRIGTGFRYPVIYMYSPDDGEDRLVEDGIRCRYYYNVPLVNEVVRNLEDPKTTYEEVLEHYSNLPFETVIDRLDTDYCTVLFLRYPAGPRGGSRSGYILQINKDGSYKRLQPHDLNYHWATLEDWHIENDQLQYSSIFGDFVLDLRSGTLKRIIDVEMKGRIIPDGTYYVESALKTNMVVDVSDVSQNDYANIQLWSNVNGYNQIIQLKYHLDGFYTLTFVHSNKNLNLQGAYTSSGANVIQYHADGTAAEQWVIKDAGDGYYYIISRVNGEYLDVSGGNTDNGTKIQVFNGNSTQAQKWRFVPTKNTDLNIN